MKQTSSSSSSKGSIGPIRTQSGSARIRVTRACDLCHKKGNKCAPSQEDGICERCLASGANCTYERPAKRRGPAPGFKVMTRSPGTQETAVWSPTQVADHEVIEALVSCYHDIVYPIFCFFHWPSFMERVRQRQYRSNRAFFATVMTVCSIASARLRDGASLSRVNVPTTGWAASEDFYRAAEDAIPVRLEEASLFEYVRATALLSITSIQQGEIARMQQHLGNYITLSTTIGLYDERRWAPNLTRIEIEERRRLFWSIYTLDVYASVVWGGVTRCREAQSLVLYPTEVDDEYITETYCDTRAQPPETLSWMRGWNFVTDLYRLLEHAIDQSRSSRDKKNLNGRLTSIYLKSPGPQEVLDLVGSMYDGLHPRFKQVYPVKYKAHDDRFSFQSANIRVTMQTVEMVVLGNDSFSVEARCRVGAKLLNDMRRVPAEYLQATSSPLLHHLAGIGQFLGEVVQGPFLRESFLQVRSVLLSLADFLAELESNLRFAAGASERLRTHVARIDEYMARVESEATSRPASRNENSEQPTQASEEVKPVIDHHREVHANARQELQEAKPEADASPTEFSNPLSHHQLSAYHHVPPPPSAMQHHQMGHNDAQAQAHAHAHAQHAQMQAHAHAQAQAQAHAAAMQSMHHSHLLQENAYHNPNHHPDAQQPGWQYQLPAELLTEWPYDLGQGPIFPDFFGFEP